MRAAGVRRAAHRDRARGLPPRGAAEDLCGADRREPPAADGARDGLRARAGRSRRQAQGPAPAAPRSGAVRRRRGRPGAVNGVRRGRTRLFALLLAIWGAVVLGRLVQIQIAQGPRYRAKAQRQQERRIEITGQRGSILDREGRELAVSVEAASIYAIPDDVADARKTAEALAPYCDTSIREMLERLRSERGFVWIRRQMDPGEAARIRALKLPGIHFVTEPRRFYPKGRLAASV